MVTKSCWYSRETAEYQLRLFRAINLFRASLEDLFQEPFTVEVLLSLVLAVCLPGVLNAFYDDHKGAERAAVEAGDHIELLIQESIDDQVPVEVTLRNRKIYIGLGLEGGIGTRAELEPVPNLILP